MIIIVESPNKTKKIREITGAKVFATVGHFCDLPNSEMGIELETYEPKFVLNKDKESNIDKIRDACLMEEEAIYIATDADREGYAIGSLLHKEIAATAATIYRLELREITEKGIKDGIANAPLWEDTNHKFFDAFLGRRVVDRLSGFILSLLASKALKGKFSVGRVQSPAVRIIVDREREIRNFIPSPYFTISAKLMADRKAFTAKFDGYPDDTQSFATKEEAETAIEAASLAKYATVESVEKKVVNRGPKAPFTTVDLQAAASISLGISPDKTMQLAQGLFEAGMITYHRTDSVRLADEFLEEAGIFVSSNFGDEYIPEKPKKYSSNSQAEAHEAIRPTHLHPLDEIESKIKEAELSADHAKLYALIFKRAVASMMSDATFDATTYKFDIGGRPFKASGSVPKFSGWMSLYNEETEDEKEAEQALPDLIEADDCEKESIEIDSKMTKAPGRFTEASLVKHLEKLGIGRPSTYASIIGRIKSAGYAVIEKKKMAATKSGEELIDFLRNNDHSWIIDYETTAQMETYLDLVADGIDGATWQTIARATHEKMGFYVPEARGDREIRPPSEKQIVLARQIEAKKDLKIPAAALTDSREMSKFLDKHLHKAEEVGKCKCGGGRQRVGKKLPMQRLQGHDLERFFREKGHKNPDH